MIIEEQQKVEIIEDKTITENTNNSQFELIKNQSNNSSKHLTITVGMFLIIFLSLIVIIFGIFTIYNYQNNSVISKGIYINGLDVSGLTKDEAKTKLTEYYSEKLANDITLVHNDYKTYLKTAEISLSFDIDSAINYAFNYGKNNNIFTDNYKIFNALITGINITPTYTFDEEALTNILNKLSAELPDAVVESGYYIEGNNLIITKGKDGYIIDSNATSEQIKQKFSDLSYLNETIDIATTQKSPKELNIDEIYNEVHTEPSDAYYTLEPHVVYPSSNGVDFEISLDEAKEILANSQTECTIPLKVLYPNITTNMIGQEAFPDLLASFSTKYSSNANRTTNLRLAAGKIDGYVLLPDEIFSYNSVVGERTISAGYKDAAVYQDGEVVQGLGGGICQISTTLYNAALYANLGIVELHNHQFVPSYVTAGRDATVVYGVKDFQFKNTRKHAIKITCSVSGGIAKFNIWGVREENEYDIDVYAYVTSKTSSYIKSSTYRSLKSNGQIVSTENIINSTYKAH